MVKAKTDVLRETRIKQGLNVVELAKKGELTHSIISRAEQGNGVSPKTALKICKALGKEFDDLFEIVSRSGEGVAV